MLDITKLNDDVMSINCNNLTKKYTKFRCLQQQF